MTLLIDVGTTGWHSDDEIAALLAPLLPGVTILRGVPAAPSPGVTMLATAILRPGLAALLPDLKLVQKFGAGVETMLNDPDLGPDVRIARLSAPEQANEMAEWALAYLLAHLRDIPLYLTQQQAGEWRGQAPRRAANTSVAILGLGHVGARTAALFHMVGFHVSGWSRSPKTLPNVITRTGLDGLNSTLADADFVISVLPSTPETRGLADAGFFQAMKPGAVFLNMGRGDLVDDKALVAALDGPLGGAVLDVFHQEPVPGGHPFWTHPKVIISPHSSGWSVDGGIPDVAENYLRLATGGPFLNEVNRAAGY